MAGAPWRGTMLDDAPTKTATQTQKRRSADRGKRTRNRLRCGVFESGRPGRTGTMLGKQGKCEKCILAGRYGQKGQKRRIRKWGASGNHSVTTPRRRRARWRAGSLMAGAVAPLLARLRSGKSNNEMQHLPAGARVNLTPFASTPPDDRQPKTEPA